MPRPIPIASPRLGRDIEREVLRVLRSGRIVQGPEVERLEDEFAAVAGVRHAVAVSSGTAALQVALWVAGIGPGDEVLVPAFTFAATANAVVAVGARPVFVDVDTFLHLDLDQAASLVGPSTAAIVPVHLYGAMTDMTAVEAFARRHRLAVIEDAAQAHLARRDGRLAGGTGIGAFSLYATKNLAAGEGGIITTHDPDIARRARLLRNHGMEARYCHQTWGLNLRMTDLGAAIARVGLRHLPADTERRRGNAALLDASLPTPIRPVGAPPGAFHVYHQYTVRVPAPIRDDLRQCLAAAGITAEVYYPTPLPHQPAFGSSERFPEAELAAREVLSLPVHPRVGARGLRRIANVAAQALSELATPPARQGALS